MDGNERDSNDAARDHETVGRALRALRQRAGLTQKALATKTGIDLTYISQVENGHRGVRWHTVMRLLRGIGVTVTDLAQEIDKPRAK